MTTFSNFIHVHVSVLPELFFYYTTKTYVVKKSMIQLLSLGKRLPHILPFTYGLLFILYTYLIHFSILPALSVKWIYIICYSWRITVHPIWFCPISFCWRCAGWSIHSACCTRHLPMTSVGSINVMITIRLLLHVNLYLTFAFAIYF